MTQNTVSYLQYLETEKHDRNTERETQRSNLAREMETMRNNMAKEREQQRSAIANELINQRKNEITAQHYNWSDAETFRSNLAREAEIRRHNLATENIDSVNAFTSALRGANEAIGNLITQQNANTNRYNAETQRMSVENTYSLGLANLENERNRTAIQQQNADTSLLNTQGQLHRWGVQNANDLRMTESNITSNTYRNELYQSETAYNQQRRTNETISVWSELLRIPMKDYNSFISSQGQILRGLSGRSALWQN